VVVFRDSFFSHVQPFLSPNFRQTIYLWSPLTPRRLRWAHHRFDPEIVVESRAGRDAMTQPPARGAHGFYGTACLKTRSWRSDSIRMTRCFISTVGAIGLAAFLLSTPIWAQDGASCSAAAAPSGPNISLILLASPERVHTLAASLTNAEVIVRDAKTVIFTDGRVISADVGSVGDHLNALGWAERKIEVVASFKPGAARLPGSG
jgi:hypothetical protein